MHLYEGGAALDAFVGMAIRHQNIQEEQYTFVALKVGVGGFKLDICNLDAPLVYTYTYTCTLTSPTMHTH